MVYKNDFVNLRKYLKNNSILKCCTLFVFKIKVIHLICKGCCAYISLIYSVSYFISKIAYHPFYELFNVSIRDSSPEEH